MLLITKCRYAMKNILMWVYTKDTGLKYAIYTRAYIYKYIYMWGCPAQLGTTRRPG